MASGIYNRFKANLMNKEVDLEADTINVMLLSGSHSFTATHNTIADVITNQISGAGYLSGGTILSGCSVTQGATTKWDGNNTNWNSGTFTASHAVIFDVTASNNLICSIDFGGAQSVSSGTLTIEWDT